MSSELGKIEKINDLRSIWPHEANDFTKWLAKEENLAALSETLGIDICLEERESSVGSFSVDLFATEEGTNRKIIIENQLEETNHDHLGKIITYASGKEAQIIIWIVKKARDEHKQAIEWLNQHTDDNIGFFLIEIELWKIGDSLPAPKFSIVERPNDWAKMVKASDGFNQTQQFQYEFWEKFNNYAFHKKEFSDLFSKKKPQAQSWMNLVNKGNCSIVLGIQVQKKTISMVFYISNDKPLFFSMVEKKAEMEKIFGQEVITSEAQKDCRILIQKKVDVMKEQNLAEIFDWYCKYAPLFKSVLSDFS